MYSNSFPKDFAVDFIISVCDDQPYTLNFTPWNLWGFSLQFVRNFAGGFTYNFYSSIKSEPKLIVGINVIASSSFSELTRESRVIQHMPKTSLVVFTALFHKWTMHYLSHLGENSG